MQIFFYKSTYWSLLLLVLACLPACGGPSRKSTSLRLPYYGSSVNSVEREDVSRSLSWEIWIKGRDLQGGLLRSPLILEGDAFVKKGDRAKALELYLKANATQLSKSEREAVTVRIAGCYLSQHQPSQALAVLSDYFRTLSSSPDQVGADFAILFGYGYAQLNNVDQSLAWFSRAHQVAASQGASNTTAEQGVREVLHSLAGPQLASVSAQWENDTLIRSLVAAERSQRAAIGSLDNPQGPDAGSTRVVVGVLLPLTGQYANLGENVRRGIELAFVNHFGELASAPVELSCVDSESDVGVAADRARELVSSKQPVMLLGPLLAEHANSVSQISREARVPLLTFSKSSRFVTGDGIFRLGATPETQVNSLLRVATGTLALTKFAIVTPNDGQGGDFADAFRSALEVRGLSPAYQASYARGDDEALLRVAQELEATQAEAVFMADSLRTATQFRSNLSPEARRRILALGPLSWDSPAELANSSTVLEGSIFVTSFLRDAADPHVNSFMEAYKARYGASPDFLAAQGYDAGNLVAEALKRGTPGVNPMTALLLNVNSLDGVTGRIAVSEDGELRRDFRVVWMKEGRISEVQSESEVSAPTQQDVVGQEFSGHAQEKVVQHEQNMSLRH